MIITRQHYFQQVSWWQFTEQSNINKEAATIVWELEGNTEANMGAKKYTTEPLQNIKKPIVVNAQTKSHWGGDDA